MNYMKEVAQLLGVELEEEFMIAVDGEKSDRKYKLTKTGCCVCKPDGEWYHTEAINRILSGIYEIVKIQKPILDAKEKEYLNNIIKPFRDCVKYITKYDSPDYEYIVIEYYDNLTEEKCEMFFPCFEKDAMYKGMRLYEKYELEELGL